MPSVRRALIASALVLAVALSGCAGAGAPEAASPGEREPVRIGAILSLSGEYASLGAAEKQALELEVQGINDAGGVDGRQIDLIIEDDATDEAQAVAAASKLIEQDEVVAIIGPTGTGPSMAVRGEIERAGIPQISLAGGTVVTDDLSPLVFQTPWSNRIVVPFVLEAVKQRGLNSIAVVSDAGGYGKDGLSVIEQTAPEIGLEVVQTETFNPGDTDMSAQLTNVKSGGAEALVLWTAGNDAVTFMQNREQLGIDLPVFGGSGQARVEFVEGAAEASNGFTFGTGRMLLPEETLDAGSPQFTVVTEFAERYEAAYGEVPDIFAGHAYDALAILVDALGRAGEDASPAELRDAIEQTDGLVGVGGVFTFTPDDHNGLTTEDLALYRVQDLAWVSVE